ncbi:MAG: ABC transporter ATP-binding protein [Oscillospiraceae bacterium]|nr:ABC transporter ATP-binding protein [Oscillospiraceae bacterium]
MENLIEVHGLCKRYKGFALENVDLTVPAGTIVGLIGENGAGKTTTLKSILHVIRPDGGTIRLLGGDPDAEASRSEVGVVFEDAYFYGGLSARQIDRIMSGIHRNWDSGLFFDYCRRFELEEKKPVKDFSRGMRMKMSLATALSHHPRLLVLDEATSGLDPVVRGELLDLFLEFIQDEAHSILLSSHITGDLERVADQIAYIHQGRLLFQRDKDELLEDTAILRCAAGEIDRLPKELVLARHSGPMGAAALVQHPEEVRRCLPAAVLDRARIDEMMQFIAGRDAQ